VGVEVDKVETGAFNFLVVDFKLEIYEMKFYIGLIKKYPQTIG
jgi:hypothetical protein